MAAPSDVKVVMPSILTGNSSPPILSSQRRAAIMEAVGDIVYGSAAGVVGKYIEYPFDTVKVRLQAQPDHLPLLYKGPIDCFRQSIHADGLLGLYRGISAPLVGAALETSSLFTFERLGREALFRSGYYSRDRPLPLSALYFAGAFSGAFTSLVLTPIELVKCKIQVPAAHNNGGKPGQTEHRRPLAVIREIYRHEGLRGFWHGQLGTLIREAGGCAAWFGGKETTTSLLRELNVRTALGDMAATPAASELEQLERAQRLHRLQHDQLPLWQQAVAGASAGMAYNFLFFPADTVKSRMQTTPVGAGLGLGLGANPDAASPQRRTFLAESQALWKQAGVRGFYRGCGVTVLRSAPSSAFIFMIYDGLQSNFPLA
ncbi:mitochondrial ornithine carrier protein [Grosmannia clavigera kw1407]|uniref:Mitochondrial ornithine carrier protein n=1 Tax=Grosmannia clavigera (strain kw1407 / UAMH 11150) TaxID=655863 RepID=F0XKL0_GROCL|nr:mitochondrial ornithine carrier protein [Grosmannia clavigera kw1407]EFX01679.1 mitochondrial ornithine carrier protein [Grosmannia clavigera kw1407]